MQIFYLLCIHAILSSQRVLIVFQAGFHWSFPHERWQVFLPPLKCTELLVACHILPDSRTRAYCLTMIRPSVHSLRQVAEQQTYSPKIRHLPSYSATTHITYFISGLVLCLGWILTYHTDWGGKVIYEMSSCHFTKSMYYNIQRVGD